MPTPLFLVVEDDPASRHVVCEMLAALGHAAHAAGTAEDAVQALKSGRYSILLTDINLPGMSGIDLANLAVKHMPTMKVIFVSGYGYLVADKTDFDFVLLSKPYGLQQLTDAIACIGADACYAPSPEPALAYRMAHLAR